MQGSTIYWWIALDQLSTALDDHYEALDVMVVDPMIWLNSLGFVRTHHGSSTTSHSTMVLFVPRIHRNLAGGMQGPTVWLPARLAELGSARARGTLQPGYVEMSKSTVPVGFGSLDAVDFSPNDTISVWLMNIKCC